MGKTNELFPRFIKLVQPPAQGAHPESGGIVLAQRIDPIMRKRRRVEWFWFINGELIAVILVETVPGAEPQISFLILQDAVDRVLRQPLIDPQAVEGDPTGLGMQQGAEEKQQHQQRIPVSGIGAHHIADILLLDKTR